MSLSTNTTQRIDLSAFLRPGLFWLILAVLGALAYFFEGLDALFVAWQLPEYSHGPLIPVLSLLLFLRQLKDVPIRTAPVNDRWPGVAVLLLALGLATVGKFSQIDDVVAYALILWVGAILLISFGWQQGRQFWPPVLHLVYMLPLPGVLYYKLSTFLQAISSELGVWMLQVIDIPVFLEGNIIDLGVYKLHVAEACSGLRYLFPILSFSYVFAILYRGPMWHKAILLLAAVPITVVMNSVRIAFAGWIVNYWGLEHLEGFSHFFEGWVIFMLCVILLFILARILLIFHPQKLSLVDALDLETAGLPAQAARIRLIEPSGALILAAVLACGGTLVWELRPPIETRAPDREPFALFPPVLGDWTAGRATRLEEDVERTLGADDYVSVDFTSPDAAAPVSFFSAYYEDQTKGGTHSPEICLPGAGWEIAWLERIDIAPEVGFGAPYHINRAVIQKGESRMMAYYWFEQHGRHVAWDFAAKMYLLWDGVTIGRTDGALVRLITPIRDEETDVQAEARLKSVFLNIKKVLPQYVPGL